MQLYKKPWYHTRGFTTFIISVLFVFVGLHSFASEQVQIDNTTVLLFLIIVLAPYIPWITKLKFGEFEAEISHKEIQEAKEKLSEAEEATPDKKYANEDVESLRETVSIDPQVALFKARVAIEERLNSLLVFYDSSKYRNRQTSISKKVRALQNSDIIDSHLASALLDITTIANRAIHGEKINVANAESMIELAIRVTSALDSIIETRIQTPVEEKNIKSQDVKSKIDAGYEVKTLIFGDNVAKEATYHFKNQAELRMFIDSLSFDSYEVIFSVRQLKIKSPSTKQSK